MKIKGQYVFILEVPDNYDYNDIEELLTNELYRIENSIDCSVIKVGFEITEEKNEY